MPRCIGDHEDLLTHVISPVLHEKHLQAALHILRKVTAAICADSLKELRNRWYVLREFLNIESDAVPDVTVADESNAHTQLACILTLLLNTLDYLDEGLFGALYPRAHGTSAV